eukprot:gene4596-836_t
MTEAALNNACSDLVRRLPPKNIEDTVASLCKLAPQLEEDLVQDIDQPLKIRALAIFRNAAGPDPAFTHGSWLSGLPGDYYGLQVKKCSQTGREYLVSDYNRDGDSHRSPHSNEYDPALPDGAKPSPKLRDLEVEMNGVFKGYTDAYFDGGACEHRHPLDAPTGLSSVYLWDLDDSAFAGAVLIHKAIDKGVWDSLHVVQVEPVAGKAGVFNYKLTSTVILHMETSDDRMVDGHGVDPLAATGEDGNVNLGGSMTRQAETDEKVTGQNTHVVHIGELIQSQENTMRQSLETVYFGKGVESLTPHDMPRHCPAYAHEPILGQQANAASLAAALTAQLKSNSLGQSGMSVLGSQASLDL